MKPDDPDGIDERSFRFFRDVCAFVEEIPEGPRTKHLIEQLLGAAGSIGANREEARGASTRKEFIRFNEVALRSANESARWLRACIARAHGRRSQGMRLLDEARQMARILGKIVVTAKRNAGMLGDPPSRATGE
jgi:four helix bundle protein